MYDVFLKQHVWKDKFLQTFSFETWIFIFEFQWTATQDFAVTSINGFFQNMFFMTSTSKVYALVKKESLFMFEAHKKAGEKNTRIDLLCNVEMPHQNLNRKNQLKNWDQRNDLFGVNFLVGYISCPFIFINKEVK